MLIRIPLQRVLGFKIRVSKQNIQLSPGKEIRVEERDRRNGARQTGTERVRGLRGEHKESSQGDSSDNGKQSI